jgi:glycosyltransferase involved in cell wall biosynthesis
MTICVALPIHNQQDIIDMVLRGIYCNSSSLVKEVIILLDGCTDLTPEIVKSFLDSPSDRPGIPTRILHAPDVFEVIANNICLKASTQPYTILVQDDMVIQELGWDVRLIKPMLVWNDVIAVSARAAHNNEVSGENMIHANMVGWEYTGQERDKFYIRDSCNRGPLALRMDMVRELNYLDEIYSPLGWDEHDLCMRAYAYGKWKSGVYHINYRSDLSWGTTRKTSASIQQSAWSRNVKIFIERYRNQMAQPKHDEVRELG